MAPSLPPCIGNAFCSHRQASCLLLVTLIPFFFPFLILCVPFFLLFLAPLSFLLFSLLLLYKVQVSIRSRHARIRDKGAFWQRTGLAEASSLDKEGRRSQVLPESAEELDGANVQSMAASEVGDMEDSHAMPSSVSDFTGEEPDDVEDLAARGELEKKQAEGNVIEGMTEKSEEVLAGSHKEQGEDEGLPSLSIESDTKEEQDIMMPSDQEEKPMEVQEGNVIAGDFQDKISTPLPSIQEHGSLQALTEEGPNSLHHSRSILTEEQGNDSVEDVPAVELGAHESVAKLDEVPWKDAGGQFFEIDRHHTHFDKQEHDGQDLGLSSEKQSGSTTLDLGLGKPEKQDLLSPMEKGVQDGEPSCSSTDGIERGRAEPFAKELQDDAQPPQGMLGSDLEVSSQSESPERDHPFKTSSSAASSTQRPLEDAESQDKIQEERKILADIYAIKKIVGYQGEAHASVTEQITALYLFLGMESYDWDVEVEDLERARAEVELLKVVVGVK